MRENSSIACKIVYEDNDILVVVKPAGIPVQPDPTGDPDVLSHLQARYGHVWLVHRLDRAVGGLVVFARTALSAGKLSTAVADHTAFEKTYLAIVPGEMQGEETLRDLLFHDTRARRAFVVDRMRGGVKEAALIRVARATRETPLGQATLLEVRLLTGRFHQIRVQLASRHMPLLGDGKYGSRVKCPLALFAYRLSFSHPRTGKRMSFTTPPPETLPWSCFSEAIAACLNA